MTITLWRIIKYGFQSFLRNKWLSLSTVSIMILTLLVFGGLILFNIFSNATVESIKAKVDISAYFKSNVSEDEILSVKRSLEGLDEVSFVEYISRDEALEIFKERHAGDETILQTLEELDENPLLASLNIKAEDLEHYDTIAAFLDSPSMSDKIERLTFTQSQLVIRRLQSLIDGLNAGVLALTLFLSFLAVMVTLNTISLAIFSNKEQIGIMRVVGASNRFIRGPYIVEGVLYGTLAALITLFIFIPVVNSLSPYLATFVPDFNLAEYFGSNALVFFFYLFLMGVGLGITSSVIAIRRHLRV